MPSKMKRPWTLADIEKLRDMAAAGMPLFKIAETFSRSYASTKDAALRHGIRITPPAAPARTEE